MILKDEGKAPPKNGRVWKGKAKQGVKEDVKRELTWSGGEERVEKRDRGVNEERVFMGGEEESDEAVRCLIEETTRDNREKLPTFVEENLETKGSEPENESG